MSRTEDYLDELLNSVSSSEEEGSQEGGRVSRKSKTPEDDFLSAFEDEILSGEDSDEFLQQFEQELDFGGKGFDRSAAASENMESLQSDATELPSMESDVFEQTDLGDDTAQPEAAADMFGGDIENDSMMEDLDSILNSAKERMDVSEDGLGTLDDGGVLMVDTLGDNLGDEAEEEPFAGGSDLEKRLENIADATDGLTGIGDLGDDFGLDDLEAEPLEEEEGTELSLEADPTEDSADGVGGKKKKRMKREKKKKKDKEGATEDGEQLSFFQKLSRLVFGEDDEEENGDKGGDGALTGDAADAEMGLFGEPDGASGDAAPDKKAAKKEKKKNCYR